MGGVTKTPSASTPTDLSNASVMRVLKGTGILALILMNVLMTLLYARTVNV